MSTPAGDQFALYQTVRDDPPLPFRSGVYHRLAGDPWFDQIGHGQGRFVSPGSPPRWRNGTWPPGIECCERCSGGRPFYPDKGCFGDSAILREVYTLYDGSEILWDILLGWDHGEAAYVASPYVDPFGATISSIKYPSPALGNVTYTYPGQADRIVDLTYEDTFPGHDWTSVDLLIEAVPVYSVRLIFFCDIIPCP